MGTKLIVFEGIDNSGKTSLSNRLQKLLDIPGHPWAWSKEPNFTTEEADFLNSGDPAVTESFREYKFMECRLRNQELYRTCNVVLDRYLWTGMAYAKVFSPSLAEFARLVYTDRGLFKQPDLTIFVDTPVEICHERETAVSVERLDRIRDAYLATKDMVAGPVIVVSGAGDVEENMRAVVHAVQSTLGIL